MRFLIKGINTRGVRREDQGQTALSQSYMGMHFNVRQSYCARY